MDNFDREVTKILTESRMQYEFDMRYNQVARYVRELFKWMVQEAQLNGEPIQDGVHFEATLTDTIVGLKILNINLANNPVFGQYVNMIETAQSQLDHDDDTSDDYVAISDVGKLPK
mgnify:FL=1